MLELLYSIALKKSTGFDAPPCTYLYIDKSMQDHGLFQAICRVNRLDGDTKEFGYIVDYKQLLEYDSVKVVIPSVNTEKITKGVFYTAITRTKKKLTIYWSSEMMEAIISGFSSEHNGFKSLEIIKNKLVHTTSSS